MKNKKELASYVYRHDGAFCLSGTLMEVKGTVALRAGNNSLDELDLKEILILAYLCSTESPSCFTSIACVTNNDESSLKNTLNILLGLGFAENDGYGYKATLRAEKILFEVAKELIEFDMFKYKQGIQEIEFLQKMLTQ